MMDQEPKLKNPETNIPDLSDINIKIPKLATLDQVSITNNETLNAVFAGISVKVDIKSENGFKVRDELNLHRVNLRIKVSTSAVENLAYVNLYVWENPDGTYCVGTDVVNKDRAMKGLGRVLWEVSIKLIQKIADEWNVHVVHEVIQNANMGLSEEKWHELFFPLLEKHNYTSQKRNDSFEAWERVYLPHQK